MKRSLISFKEFNKIYRKRLNYISFSKIKIKFRLTKKKLEDQFKILKGTSAEWAFGPGCFCYSASVLEPRHIGVRPKGMTFGLGC